MAEIQNGHDTIAAMATVLHVCHFMLREYNAKTKLVFEPKFVSIMISIYLTVLL